MDTGEHEGPVSRDENPDAHERRDRQMMELLNELRVALPGVQILFAFLLTVPFSQGWDRLNTFQRDVYFVTLLAAMLSTAFLIAPSAAHRLRFHKRDRAWVIESANRMSIAGLFCLAAAMTGAMLLISDLLFDGSRVWLYAIAIGAVFLFMWFVRPLLRTGTSGP